MNRLILILALSITFTATAAHAENTGGHGISQASLPNVGKVIEVVDAKGYTYLHIEDKDNKEWIAGRAKEIKKGDTVRYSQGNVMRNFFSKTLNRTFPRVIFTGAIQLEQSTTVTNSSPQATVAEGHVVSATDSGGYTYIEARQNDKTVWLASPQTAVKKGDAIRYVNDGAGMRNFYSKTLNREFSEILFVGEVQIIQ